MKWWTADVQNEVLDACVQLYGGYGYMNEYRVARAWRDARVSKIWAGSNEIMKELIGRDLGLVTALATSRPGSCAWLYRADRAVSRPYVAERAVLRWTVRQHCPVGDRGHVDVPGRPADEHAAEVDDRSGGSERLP